MLISPARFPETRVPFVRTAFFRTVAAACLVAGMAVGLAGCGAPPPSKAASAVVGAQPAAVINGETIYQDEVQIAAERMGVVDKGELLQVDSAEFEQVLAKLIDTRLMAQAAVKKQLDADRYSRFDLNLLRETKLANLLLDAVTQEQGEAAIRKAYDAQVEIFNRGGSLGTESRVRLIVAANKADADAIMKQLSTGGDFAVIATQKSIDQDSKLDGGDLGYLTSEKAGATLSKVIDATAVGAIARPFQLPNGWAILKVEDRRKEQPPRLEELRPMIKEWLRTKQTEDVLRDLYKSAKIERFTSPRNAPIESDPFTLAPSGTPIAPETGPPVAGIEASAPKSAATTSPAPVPAAPPSAAPKPTPAPAAKPTAAAPAAPKPPAASPSPTPTTPSNGSGD
jgi:peptidyl-prolyl cis-trans isomerase C